MTNPWERAEEALVSLEQRTQYDEKNRLELLSVHALKGLLVGPLILKDGGPDAWNILFGNDTLFFLAAPAFFGGLLLMIGLLWNRNILLEAVGMALMLVWDGLMLYTLGRAGLTTYVLVVYGAMMLLMLVHAKTLFNYIRARWKQAPNE